MRTETWRHAAAQPRNLFYVGIGGCALALLTTAIAAEAALKAWLAAAFFWSGIPIGALGFVMMMRLIPGLWSDELAGPMERVLTLLPVAGLAALPVLAGLPELYPWVGQEQENGFRSVYLSSGFFVIRSVLGFTIFGLLSLLLVFRRGWSVPVSCIGLLVYVPMASVTNVDWLMSLDPDFHSSGFGLYALSIQMTIALAAAAGFAIVSGAPLARPGVVASLMLSALLAWAYFAFMQYFILWSGNLPEGVLWYQRRAGGGWTVMLWLIAVLHAMPLMTLIFRPARRDTTTLLGIVAAVLVGKALEVVWLVVPAGAPASPWLTALFLTLSFVGIGALSAAALLRGWRQDIEDPASREVIP